MEPCSEETKRKIGNANRGRKFPPHSEEHNQKISEGVKKAYAKKQKTITC